MHTILTTDVFDLWFEQLRDNQAKARIKARLRRAGDGNFGDVKPVGKGISEMRIHYGAGYRLYFMQNGFEIVLLLAGGDKSTQASDIQTALALARKLKEEK
ncbi:putative addiction module killer protein [Methylobacter tundripaludum]|uniref:Putative addiction module killer protein n=1 Tax=Methylobacter tundripaludum TaxID=173365 RepID=A0A2S6H7M4_9GAMM|nr:type II toxin-antitoxin system RelE/ParE family toxin [Methylobacter tundripaludum]PPK73413.1 putative addiction module killer protein [Methylobacter tundripaludum]